MFFKNSLWSALEYFYLPLIVALTTPLIIKSLGLEIYGLWILFLTTINLSFIITIGISSSLITLIAKYEAEGENQKTTQLIHESFFWGFVLLIIILITIIITWLSLKTSEPNLFNNILFQTYCIGALAIAVEIFDSVNASSLKAILLFKQNAVIEILFRTIQALSIILLLYFDASIVSLYISTLFILILKFFFKLSFTKNKFNNYLSIKKPSRNSELLHTAKWGFVQGLSGIIFNQIDKYIINFLFGISILGKYSLLILIPTFIHSFFSAALRVIVPVISKNEKIGKSSSSLVKSIFYKNITFSLILYLLSIFTIRDTYYYLSGYQLDDEMYQTYLITTLGYFLLTSNITHHYYFIGLGLLKKIAISNLIAGLLIVPIYLFPNENGLNQVPIGKIFYAIFIIVYFVFLFKTNRSQKILGKEK